MDNRSCGVLQLEQSSTNTTNMRVSVAKSALKNPRSRSRANQKRTTVSKSALRSSTIQSHSLITPSRGNDRHSVDSSFSDTSSRRRYGSGNYSTSSLRSSFSPSSVASRSSYASQSSISSYGLSNYSLNSLNSINSSCSIDSRYSSRGSSFRTTTSSISPEPIDMEFKADIPLDKTSSKSIPCTAILSYQSRKTNKWILVCIVHCDESDRNKNKVFLYETDEDVWESLRRTRSRRVSSHGSDGFDILYPEHPEEVVIDSDRDELYLLDQGMRYNLERKKWESKSLLPVVTQWETYGSSTIYIGGNVREFHGLYHDSTDYGLRHLIINPSDMNRNGSAVSTHGHVHRDLRFSGLQMIYCDWLQQLTVFGGRVARRDGQRSKYGRNIPKMSNPGSFAIEQWDENQFSYHCNIGRHHRNSTKLSKQKFRWKRSANKVGNLYHTEMRAVVVFDHIAIVFKYFGKDQYIEMRCWDLIFNKRQRSPYVLDFECGRFDDLCVLKTGDGDIHIFDRRGRDHVEVNALEIMSATFRAKTEVRYKALVRGYCQSKALGQHTLKLIQNYLFALAASFACGCHGCVSLGQSSSRY